MKYSNQIRRTVAFAAPAAAMLLVMPQLRGEDCCKPSAVKQTAGSAEVIDRQTIEPDRISLFAVSLQCAAAPEIGCGSRAKPLLGDLEHRPGLTGAWLNEAGTVLAVVSEKGSPHEARLDAVRSASKDRKITANELTDARREEALKNFRSGRGWRGSAGMDELSTTEAQIIAARLVRRINEKHELPDEQAARLRAAFARVFAERFSKAETGEAGEELLRVASGQLDSEATAALREAIAAGYRPLAGEK